MTSAEIKANNAELIGNKTEEGSILKTDVSGQLDDIVDYVDQKMPYKEATIALTRNGSNNFVATVLKNEFTGITFSFADLGNGQLSITASGPTFTNNKYYIIPTMADGGGVPYFFYASGNLGTTIQQLNVTKFDGTSTSTPTFSNVLVEIRVYP